MRVFNGSLFVVAVLALLAAPVHAAHNTCAGAESVHPNVLFPCGTTAGSADTGAGATDNYDGSSCTGGNSNGNDLVWYADLVPGNQIDVTLSPSAVLDAVVYIATDCGDIVGTCVAGADAGGPGAPEVLSYLAGPAGRYFVIFDSNTTNGPAGGTSDFVAEVRCDGGTPNEDTTWAHLKSVYR